MHLSKFQQIFWWIWNTQGAQLLEVTERTCIGLAQMSPSDTF